jgi:ribonuclease P protein component
MVVNPYTQEVLSRTRAGLIIGKSVGGSVRRHRVSRQIRHALAPLLSNFPQGSLIVIRGLKPSGSVDVHAEINEIANRLIERAAKRMASTQ